MGNSLACFSIDRKKLITGGTISSPIALPGPPGKLTGLLQRTFSKKKVKKNQSGAPEAVADDDDDALIREQAMAAVMLLKQYQRNGSVPLSRSSSVAHQPQGGKDKPALRRSSTTRQPSLIDSHPPPPSKLVNQDVEMESLETRHFVLVHGGGFGAWCWYKTMTLLTEAGFKVDAVDLTGSGVHSIDTNSIKGMAQYVKPLVEVLEKLEESEKVILVGHDFGGACISYVMEIYPSKIAKAVFVAAAMLKDGQSTLDMFSQQEGPSKLMQQAQIFLYGNGRNQPPTAIELDKSLAKDLFFNQTPAKDAVLASVSMRPIPFALVLEKLSLSAANHGAVRRFYIQTTDDYAIPISLQEAMINSNPPERVFCLKGSDHSPFFSKPQGLHRLLVEISKIPSNSQA